MIIVALVLLNIGIIGVISRKNIFIVYMSLELIFNSLNLILISVYKAKGIDLQVFVLFNLAISAAEAAIFISLIVKLYFLTKEIDIDKFNLLRQR